MVNFTFPYRQNVFNHRDEKRCRIISSHSTVCIKLFIFIYRFRYTVEGLMTNQLVLLEIQPFP